MSFESEYYKLRNSRKKKKEEKETTTSTEREKNLKEFSDTYYKLRETKLSEDELEIAPVKNIVGLTDEEYQNKWGKYTQAEDFAKFSVPTGSKIKDVGWKFWEDDGDELYDFINDINQRRRTVEGLTRGSGSSNTTDGKYGDYTSYTYMDEEEIGIYNYIYATEGKDKADEYLDDITETLNARRGTKTYNELSPVGKAMYWLPTGIDKWNTNVEQFFSSEELPTSYVQMVGEKIQNDYDEASPILSLANKGLVTVSEQIPNIILSKGLSGVASVLGAGAKAASVIGNVGGALGTAVSSSGGAYKEALSEGKTEEEAYTYSRIVGALEGSLQYVIGGIEGLGGVATSEKLMRKVATIENSLLRNIAKHGIRIGSETFEEEAQLFLEPLVRSVVFNEEYDTPEIDEIVETALVTAISTGILNSVSDIGSGGKVNGLSVNEAKVVEAEVENRIKAKEESGKKLTSKQKDGIYNEVVKDLEKGYISTDTIESVLGGKTYEEYKTSIDRENAVKQEIEQLEGMPNEQITVKQAERLKSLRKQLSRIQSSKDQYNSSNIKSRLSDEVFSTVKDSKLAESYNEIARKNQALEIDVTKYTGKARQTVENAIKSGANNTNRVRDLVELSAKVSADRDKVIDFVGNEEMQTTLEKQLQEGIDELNSLPELTEAQKQELAETEELLERVKNGEITVNGNVTKDGITINLDSNKPLNFIIGHDITHTLEGTEAYKTLQSFMFKYAEKMGDYDGRIKTLEKIYKRVKGTNVENELMSDLAGDYLFSDYDFILNLATNHRNVFQKVYDEIKYLCKLATAGSQEERLLLKAQEQYRRAWREASNTTTDTQYSISEIIDQNKKSYGVGVHLDSTLLDNLDPKERVKMVKEYVKELGGKTFTAYDNNGNPVEISIAKPNEKFKNRNEKNVTVTKDLTSKYIDNEVKQEAIALVDELVTTSKFDNSKPSLYSHGWLDNNGKNNWEYWTTYIQDKNNTIWEATLNIANSANGEKILYDISPIKKAGQSVESDTSAANNSIAPLSENINKKFSLSENNAETHKEKQFDIIQATNPMWDDYHTGIRSVKDILTWDEVLELDDEREGQFVWGDFSRENAEEALADNSITVYSSYPIKNGTFVSTSYMQAYEYAGGEANSKVYSKTIPLNAVAWINGDEGQYARVEDTTDNTAQIRYPLSDSKDSDGETLTVKQTEFFKGSKMRDENGNLKVMYHGLGNAGFHEFMSDFSDDGTSLIFVDSNTVAKSYSGTYEEYSAKAFNTAEDFNSFFEEINADGYEVNEENGQFVLYDDGEVVATSETAEGLYDEFTDWTGLGKGNANYKVYLNLTNPLEINADGQEWDSIDIPKEHLKGINESWGISAPSGYIYTATTREIAEYAKRQGYDSVIFKNLVDNGGYASGQDRFNSSTVAIAFDSNQVKSVVNKNPTSDPDIKYSLSDTSDIAPIFYSQMGNETPKTYGNFNVYGKDFKIAPVQEDITGDVTATPGAQLPISDIDLAPVADKRSILEAKIERVKEQIKAYNDELANYAKLGKQGKITVDEYIAETEKLAKKYGNPNKELFDLQEQLAKVEEAEADEQRERLYSLDDFDAPFEKEKPIYSDRIIPDDPLKNRDETKVGNPKIKAYMYENPEVKPFFQEEARTMLGDLQNSTKGERIYTPTDHVAGEYGSDSYGVRAGIPRITTDDIAYLLDNWHYTYAEIEKGLEAIIKDNGTENNACSKRIEFMLNDRLLKGYKDISGHEIPPNQDYINLLNEKQITEYSQEAFEKLLQAENVTPVEDIAPISEAIKPLPEQLSPEEQRMTDNKMARADVPPREQGTKQMKWVETATDSEVVNRKILPDDLDKSKITYQPISNRKTLNNANAMLNRDGYEKSVEYFNAQFRNKRTTLDDVALGERLIQEALKSGDTKTAGELIQDVAILGKEFGQKIQILSIIQRLTPAGQLRMLQRTVERGKTKGDKAFEGVEITQDMIDHILKTYGKDGSFDQKELNKAVEDVKQKIADQMKVTAGEKINAWRYLSMLGNPKTHHRNIVSNVAMKGATAVKNAVARTIEDIAPIKNKTKTWKPATSDVKAFAKQTTEEMKDIISGDSKYSEDASIKSKRAIFANNILNNVYEFNSNLLSKEDWWFSRPVFKNSLSEFLTANGFKTKEDIENNPELVEKGKAYALEQSQIATFRQQSALAKWISDIENKNAVTKAVVGSILPFKKTPINIAKTGLNYSPLGFAKTLTYDVVQVKNGNMEASELVDHLAQNLTGTGLALAGYMLAQSGLLNGAGEDDEEGNYDYQLGEQSYSLNIGGNTYSLSWLSPVAMPLFVGANAYEQLVEGKEWNGNAVIEALGQTLDPLSEMSFLSGLDSVLSSYESGMGKFFGIGQSMVQNYASQFIPTLSSQIATVMDDTKRSTKVSGDSEFKFVEETINILVYKIPKLRETLEPSIDIWGNEIKQTDNMFNRAVETFIAPYSRKENIATEIDEELKDLYSETGESGLLPDVPNNYIDYNGEKYRMSDAEFTAYKKTYGQTAADLLEELFDTTTYRNVTSEEKSDMVNDVYDHSRDKAKKQYLAGEGVIYTNAKKDGKEYYKENDIVGAIENDMPLEEFDLYNTKPGKYAVSKAVGGFEAYQTYSEYYNDLEADKDENGKSISGSKKEKFIDYINILDIEYGEKIILLKSHYKTDDRYNQEIIDYLNNRADISTEEMILILKELGFTVDDDLNIYWN